MKKFSFSLVLLALLLLGYGAWWHRLASDVESKVTAQLAQWQDEGSWKLVYDKLEKTGFPFDVGVAFVNPRLVIQGDEGEVATASLDGKLQLQRRLWGEHSYLETEGHLLVQANGSNYEELWRGELTGKSSLSLVGKVEELLQGDPNSKELAWHWTELRSRWEEGNLELRTGQDELTALPSVTQRLDWGKSFLLFSRNDPEADFQEMDFDFDFQGLRASSDQSQEYAEQLQLLSPWLYLANQLSFSGQDYGLMKVKGKGSVVYPHLRFWEELLSAPLQEREQKWALAIDHFAFDSQMAELEEKGLRFDLQQKGDTFSLKYQSQAEGNYLAHYGKVLRQKLAQACDDQVVADLLFSDHSEDGEKLSGHCHQLAELLIPNVGPWGPIEGKIELEVDTTPAKREAKVQLNHWKWELKPYSIALTGNYSTGESHDKAVATLFIDHYESLFASLAAYWNRIGQFLNRLQLQSLPPLPIVQPLDLQDWISFLHAIADGQARESLSITVSYQAGEGIQVGKLDFLQFMEQWQQLLISLLQRERTLDGS